MRSSLPRREQSPWVLAKPRYALQLHLKPKRSVAGRWLVNSQKRWFVPRPTGSCGGRSGLRSSVRALEPIQTPTITQSIDVATSMGWQSSPA